MAVQVELHSQTDMLPSLDQTLSFRGHNYRLTIARFDRFPNWLGPVMTKLDMVLAQQRALPPTERREIDPRAIEFGLDFLLSLLPDDFPVPWVVPVRNGGIQFEWHHHGIDIEVELTRDGGVIAAFEDAMDEASSWETELGQEITPLRNAISVFRSRNRALSS